MADNMNNNDNQEHQETMMWKLKVSELTDTINRLKHEKFKTELEHNKKVEQLKLQNNRKTYCKLLVIFIN